MNKPIISVENLSKAYRLGLKQEVPDTFVSALAGVAKAPFKNFRRLRRLDTSAGGEGDDILWALRDVNFEVHEGEVVGIIGRNGAGKSTLLKILSRITEPTAGCVKLRGRVSSLLEVGTGFHPELTGRDNVYMNGTILGMMKSEIDRKFDEIVDFSGVEKFLDTPVKRYSSGMLVRLAFAVAAHLEPEILIVDEVLAVGDAEFQKKCLGKMQDVSSSGRTVLFVSHNMAAVQGLCGRGVLLHAGEVLFDGLPHDAIEKHLSTNNSEHKHLSPGRYRLTNRTNVYGDRTLIIRDIALFDVNGKPSDTFQCSREMSIKIIVEGFSNHAHAQIGIIIRNSHGDWIANFNSGMRPPQVLSRSCTEVITVALDRIPLVPGSYRLDISIADKVTGRIDYVEDAAPLNVEPFDIYGTGYAVTRKDGQTYLEGQWTIDSFAK